MPTPIEHYILWPYLLRYPSLVSPTSLNSFLISVADVEAGNFLACLFQKNYEKVLKFLRVCLLLKNESGVASAIMFNHFNLINDYILYKYNY